LAESRALERVLMTDPEDGRTHDDDEPTRAPVDVYLPRDQGSVSVRGYEDAIAEGLESEIRNKIVEAVAAWAQDFNERNRVRPGAARHCRRVALNASLDIEE
jgi:hypothetical protein